jgi:hypothetical protein
MSRDTTTPIPFVSDEEVALTQERLARLAGPLDAVQGRTDTTGGGTGEGRVAHATALSREIVGAQAVLLLVARLRAQTQDALSRPMPLMEVHQEAATARANGNGAASRELPVADFMEPVEYGWTEAGFEARQALKRYCEETHADY